MADPHHVEPLDVFDRFTVLAYRVGLFLGALGVGSMALCWGTGQGATVLGDLCRFVVLLATALVVAHLHLYDRFIRWAISASGWLGALLTVLGGTVLSAWSAGGWLLDAGLGFQFVVLSATALKERYCFKLPLVVVIPPLLAVALLPVRAEAALPAAVLLGAASLVLLLLAFAKAKMPLHYDIGDKRRYQV